MWNVMFNQSVSQLGEKQPIIHFGEITQIIIITDIEILTV